MNASLTPGPAPGARPMAMAARALHAVRESGLIAEEALQRIGVAPVDRAATRAILAGSIRMYLRLAPAVNALLRPGQQMDSQVHALLVVAAYQIEYSRGLAPVIVNIAVDAARVLDLGSSAGFVNALLRRFVAERHSLLEKVDRSEAAASAHPRWLLREIRAIADERADEIIAANNEAPPMTLRVNLLRTTRAAQLQALRDAGIAADEGALPMTIVLADAVDVERLPGFAAGDVSVQDAGAQHAALLLEARPGERVLDACAAPGGKTGHLLEHTPDLGELVAMDVSADRLGRVASNLARLNLHATLIAADLMSDPWWDGRPFDRILLDAPCSATGVIRRHPDIKLLRRPEDIAGFAATQQAMLARCAAMLSPGGTLLYATCSILRAENQQVVAAFLESRPGWSRSHADLQLLPTPRASGPQAVTDGFYYACLKKGGLESRMESGAQT